MIIITNRKLCWNQDIVSQIRKIAPARPKCILLREKDISSAERIELGSQIQEICQRYEITFGINSDIEAAKYLKADNLHLPFEQFRQLTEGERNAFSLVGTSVHSLHEAVQAEKMGAGYIIAGHIFETECKKGLEPRGIAFLQEISWNVTIPIYGIGGINHRNAHSVLESGANGICIMSGAMTSKAPVAYLKKFPKDA